jgi:hypothetical protein
MFSDAQHLRAFIEKSRIRPIRIYQSMDISKQAFYKLYVTKEFEPETIKKIEKAVGTKWEEIKQTKVDGNIDLLVSKPQVQNQSGKELSELLESNRILADANKTLADAHKDITRANLELVQMFKELNYRTQSPVLNESDQSTGNTQKRIDELNRKGRSGPFSRPSGGKQ